MLLLLIITPTFGHLIATNHKTGTGVGWKLSDYFDEPIDVHYHGYTNPRFINTVLICPFADYADRLRLSVTQIRPCTGRRGSLAVRADARRHEPQ